MRLPRGRWNGEHPELSAHGIGLLVLDGMLLRRVGVDGRFGAELLGEGDLLRPWQGGDAEPTLPHTTGWRVLQACRAAVLDDRVARRFARYPQLTAGLVGRALDRSRNLAVNMAIVHQPRIQVRLHMLLWHLAERWGRVGTDGVVFPVRLTHTVLADLVTSQRPTVSLALADLEKRNLVRTLASGFLLIGEPPGELLELRPIAVRPAKHPLSLTSEPERARASGARH